MSSHVRVVTQKSHESDRGSQVTRFDSHVRQGSCKSGNIVSWWLYEVKVVLVKDHVKDHAI